MGGETRAGNGADAIKGSGGAGTFACFLFRSVRFDAGESGSCYIPACDHVFNWEAGAFQPVISGLSHRHDSSLGEQDTAHAEHVA